VTIPAEDYPEWWPTARGMLQQYRADPKESTLDWMAPSQFKKENCQTVTMIMRTLRHTEIEIINGVYVVRDPGQFNDLVAVSAAVIWTELRVDPLERSLFFMEELFKMCPVRKGMTIWTDDQGILEE
jgi:hypothetical protein